MNEEQLKIIIKAETAQLQKEIQKAKKEFGAMADEAKKSTNSISSSLKNLVKGISLAAITHQIVKLGNAALNLASQLEEVQNVVNVSFGSMSAEVEQFAKNALKQFGLSELTAKKTASSYMAMANGMGLLAEDGKNMSLQLTALTGDMASFYNVTTDVAQTALASVFTGETESLKQFGIVMTEANLEAFALSQGIQKQYSAFTQAEKVALRYQYVLQATANAQGDFVRTGDSWANQTRILKEQWNSLLGILGKAVMNVLAPLIKGLNQVLSYILSIGTAISSLFGGQKVSNLSKPIQEVSQGASNVGSAFNNASSEIDKANSKAKKLANTVLGFDELNILNAPTEDTSASSGGVGIGGAGAGIEIAPFEFKTEDINTDGLVKKIKDMFSALNPYIEAFKEGLKFEELKANLSDIFADISERAKEFYESLDFSKYEEALVDYSGTLGEHINVVITTLSNMAHEAFKVSFDSFAPAVSTFINDTLPVIIEIFTQLTSITTTVISTIGNCVTTVIKSTEPVVNLAGKILVDLQNSFNNFWNKYGKPITDEFKLAIENIGDTFNKFWNSVVSPIIQMLSNSLGELWNNHVSPLVDNILNAIGELITGILKIYNTTLKPVMDFIITTFAPLINNAIKGIVDFVTPIIGNLIDAFNGIITTLKGIIEFVVGVFTGDWEKAWEGVRDIFKGVWDTLSSLIKVPINAIIDVINKLISAATTGINYVIKALNRIKFTIPSWVPFYGGRSFGISIPTLEAPQIPKLAEGGIATRSVLANIGEAGKEAVLPLENNTEWMDILAERIASVTQAPSKIILQLDGKELGWATINNINSITRQTGELQLKLV